MGRKIDLTEERHKGEPNTFSVRYLKGEPAHMNADTYDFFASKLDNHYLLKSSIHLARICDDVSSEVWGVSDNVEDAELRLYKRAKKVGELLAEEHEAGDLEDRSEYAQKGKGDSE